MDKNYFAADSYKTEEGKKPVFLDRAALGSSMYYLAKFAAIILKSRSIALKGKLNKSIMVKMSYEIFDHIEDCGGRFEITGLDNLRNCSGPVVFISNHMSTLETMVFPCIIAPIMDVNFVVKEGNIKNPFFGAIMRSMDPVVVGRTNSREDFQVVMSKGKEELERGVSIVVFPEGSRKRNFNPAEFNSIGIKLALKAGVQVVPVAIKTDFWETGKIFRDMGPINRKKPIYISFGEAMQVTGNGRNEHKAVIEFISAHLKRWGHI